MNDRLLPWPTINALVCESGAIDEPMLASYLRLTCPPTERQALRVIESLRIHHPQIWQRRVTPRDYVR